MLELGKSGLIGLHETTVGRRTFNVARYLAAECDDEVEHERSRVCGHGWRERIKLLLESCELRGYFPGQLRQTGRRVSNLHWRGRGQNAGTSGLRVEDDSSNRSGYENEQYHREGRRIV